MLCEDVIYLLLFIMFMEEDTTGTDMTGFVILLLEYVDVNKEEDDDM